MNTDTKRKIKQRKCMLILSFGLLMLLYAVSKDPKLINKGTDKCSANSFNVV